LSRIGGSGGFEPHESSILHFAWTQAVAPHHATPEAWLVEGGIAQVTRSLVEQLADKLRLSSPVEAIRQEAGGAEGSFASGERFGAAAVVVAEPPPLRLGIRFTLAMVPELQDLSQRPFWRERGLNGLAIGNLPVLDLTLNCTPPDGPGLLAGFIAAERALRWQSMLEAERRRAVPCSAI
jgi:monoamine oxidase